MKRLASRDYATALLGAYHDAAAKDRPAVVRKFLELLRRQRAMRLLPRILDWLERLDDQAAGRTRDARKVIVVALGFLGDSIHLIPALWEIKRNYPGAELHVAATPLGCEVIRLVPCVHRIWPVARNPSA